MTAHELIDKLSQVAPDMEVISGDWNGKVDTYTVLDLFLNMPCDSVYADFFGTPGAFDFRMMDIKSPEVVYLGSTFKESDPRVSDDRRFKPDCVLGCYVTNLWREGMSSGNMYSVDFERLLPRLKRLILVGNLRTNADNPIMVLDHMEIDLHGDLITRSDEI